MSSVLFSDQFTIRSVDADGKYFDKVSRLHAYSETLDASVVLDVASHIFHVQAGDILTIALAASLHDRASEISGNRKDNTDWLSLVEKGKGGLLDQYDYVCHGRVYKVEDHDSSRVYAFFFVCLFF